MKEERIYERLVEHAPDAVTLVSGQPGCGGAGVEFAPETALELLTLLRDDSSFAMQVLEDMVAMDTLGLVAAAPAALLIVYRLESPQHGHRAAVCIRLQHELSPSAPPTAQSVAALWKAASWLEREIHDLFGISFEGNDDLRRLLCPEDWQGHAMRKVAAESES